MTDELRIGERIEWAVLQPPPQGLPAEPRVVQGGLGSEEEADAYLAALEITRKRRERDSLIHPFYRQSMPAESACIKAWRTVGAWSPPEFTPPG